MARDRTHLRGSLVRNGTYHCETIRQSHKSGIVVRPTRKKVNFTPEFHPDHSRLLKIGTRSNDGSPVYITFLAGDLRPSRVLNDDLALIGVHKLSFAGNPLLELNNFKGDTKREMEASRRDYLAALIEEHKLKQGDSLSNGVC